VALSEAQRRVLQLVGFVAAIPVALFVLWFVIAEYEDWRYVHPWQRVAGGDSEERVVALLGRPHRVVVEWSAKASWESEHTIDWYDAESVKEYRYVPFSITGEEYGVGFDSSGHAVSKFHITSP
jgi:hypothetical protein